MVPATALTAHFPCNEARTGIVIQTRAGVCTTSWNIVIITITGLTIWIYSPVIFVHAISHPAFIRQAVWCLYRKVDIYYWSIIPRELAVHHRHEHSVCGVGVRPGRVFGNFKSSSSGCCRHSDPRRCEWITDNVLSTLRRLSEYRIKFVGCVWESVGKGLACAGDRAGLSNCHYRKADIYYWIKNPRELAVHHRHEHSVCGVGVRPGRVFGNFKSSSSGCCRHSYPRRCEWITDNVLSTRRRLI